MLVINNLKLPIFIFLSLLNLGQIAYFFEKSEYIHVLIFYFGIMLNQAMLFVVVADIIGIEKNTSFIPTWLMAPFKLILLVMAFLYAFSHTSEKELILVEMYIFQLIILVLSTKRVVKKN